LVSITTDYDLNRSGTGHNNYCIVFYTLAGIVGNITGGKIYY